MGESEGVLNGSKVKCVRPPLMCSALLLAAIMHALELELRLIAR